MLRPFFWGSRIPKKLLNHQFFERSFWGYSQICHCSGKKPHILTQPRPALLAAGSGTGGGLKKVDDFWDEFVFILIVGRLKFPFGKSET